MDDKIIDYPNDPREARGLKISLTVSLAMDLTKDIVINI